MNKIFSKIATLSVGLAMAAGVGLAFNHGLFESAEAAKGDAANGLLPLNTGAASTVDGNNKISWQMLGGKIAVEQIRGCASSAASSSERTFTAVNSNYISAPRLYRGNYLAFTCFDEYMITKLEITCETKSYFGAGQIVGDTLNNSASLTVKSSQNSYPVTGAIGVVSDTTNYTVSTNDSTKMLTVECLKQGGTSSLYIQNYDNNEDLGTTQLRPTSIKIYYIVGNESKTPDEVVVSGSASLTVGQKSLYSASVKNQGSATDVDQTVAWSVSDSRVLLVDALGNVTALDNGTANVIATTPNSIVGSLSITVSGASTDVAPKTFSPTTLGLSGNSYAPNNGVHAYKNFVMETYQVSVANSDYIDKQTSEVIAYEKNGILMQKSNGLIRNKTLGAAKISAVSISGVSDTAPALTVAGSNTVDGTDVESGEVISSGRIHRYEFETPVNYVTVAAGSTGAVYLNSITFEFVGGVETVDSLADYILGLVPDRNEETGMCLEQTGNYKIAKARYVAAPEGVRSAFETSEDETVVLARTRYLAWAAAFGDSTPFALQTTQSSFVLFSNPSNNNNMTLIIIVAVAITLLGVSGTIILKKKHNK